jgi:hypothetical protein
MMMLLGYWLALKADEIIVSEKDAILPGFDEIDWEF